MSNLWQSGTVDLPAGKTIVGYGAGLAAHQALVSGRHRPRFLVSDRAENAGTVSLDGVPVLPVSALEALDPAETVVVVLAFQSQSVQKIFARLRPRGYIYGENLIDYDRFCFASLAERAREFLCRDLDRELFDRVHLSQQTTEADNRTGALGTFLIAELLRHCRDLGIEGDVAELGVYQGSNALTILEECPDVLRARTFHLFDSFSGFSPDDGAADSHRPLDDFRDVSFSDVERRFSDFENVILHKGYFSETLEAVQEKAFALAYFDADLYDASRDAIEALWPRVVPNGLMVFHDYVDRCVQLPKGETKPFRGVSQAVDEFCSRTDGVKRASFPETTHIVLIKSD